MQGPDGAPPTGRHQGPMKPAATATGPQRGGDIRNHRAIAAPFAPALGWPALEGEPLRLRPSCFAPKPMGRNWTLRPGRGQICGRCAKEKGGIPAVVFLPTMTMQLLKSAPFRAMVSYATAPKGRRLLFSSLAQKEGGRIRCRHPLAKKRLNATFSRLPWRPCAYGAGGEPCREPPGAQGFLRISRTPPRGPSLVPSGQFTLRRQIRL